MPSDAWPSQPQQSLESLKHIFKRRLNIILGMQLTLENAATFADEALAETIKLNEDILREYKNNPNVHARPNLLTETGREDEAFAIFGLDGINKILDHINKIKDSTDSIKTYIKNRVKVSTVIKPPKEGGANIITGAKSFEKRKGTVQRLFTLIYILKHDFEIELTPENIPIQEGIVAPAMMRRVPYVRVEIPSLNRAVYICDEEDNITYVFDTLKLREIGLTLDEIDLDDKKDTNSLIVKYPGLGVRIMQNENWRSKMTEILEEKIPEKIVQERKEKPETLDTTMEEIPKISKGELDPWKGFYTDPATGKHWGTKNAIAKKLKRTETIFKTRKVVGTARPIMIIFGMKGGGNRVENGYCYEEVLELFPELQISKQVDGEGEWKGFWTDPETKKHWAPINSIKSKSGIGDFGTVERFISRNSLTPLSLTDLTGHVTKSYCYEDFLEIEEVVEFLTAPEVKIDGEWKGFLIDGTGVHWAPVGTLARHFDVANNTIEKYIAKIGLSAKKVKFINRDILNAYPLDGFTANEEFKQLVEFVRPEKEGIWQSFWTDQKTGEHWGTSGPIAAKLGISKNILLYFVKKNRGKYKIRSKTMKPLAGKITTGYCFEEIERIWKEKK